MSKPLVPHPVALLFPELPPADYEALKEDIRQNGVKVPILVHGGQILDGRHRYRACRELNVRCLVVEWNGHDPWLEVQSRNLVRRHLAKDQVYAIRKLAAQQFPELAAPIEEQKAQARARKAQAKGQPRGRKALTRSQDRYSESADLIGKQIGVSGTTVKRVDRVAREAPELLTRVAAGEMSVKQALRLVVRRTDGPLTEPQELSTPVIPVPDPLFSLEPAKQRLERLLQSEWQKWPRERRASFLHALQVNLHRLIQEHSASGPSPLSTRRAVGEALGSH